MSAPRKPLRLVGGDPARGEVPDGELDMAARVRALGDRLAHRNVDRQFGPHPSSEAGEARR